VRDLLTASQRVGSLDDLARLDTPIHRLDARAKVLVTLVYAATAISFPKYALAQLAPLALYPAVVIALGGLPVGALLRRLLPAMPLVLLIGAFNPFFDRRIMTHVGGLAVTGGWLSFGSIAVRLALTVLAGLLLIATTGIDDLCRALMQLGAPRVLATQILLMYRYLFVLVDETGRVLRAHALRGGGRSVALRLAGPLAGQLLLRALDRAQRIHWAMLARGFDGHTRPWRSPRASWTDAAWVAGWCGFCLLTRLTHLPRALGEAVMGALAR
jgi:cobalt/nickel transport system permease protein